jgi:hypothetical protein
MVGSERYKKKKLKNVPQNFFELVVVEERKEFHFEIEALAF